MSFQLSKQNSARNQALFSRQPVRSAGRLEFNATASSRRGVEFRDYSATNTNSDGHISDNNDNTASNTRFDSRGMRRLQGFASVSQVQSPTMTTPATSTTTQVRLAASIHTTEPQTNVTAQPSNPMTTTRPPLLIPHCQHLVPNMVQTSILPHVCQTLSCPQLQQEEPLSPGLPSKDTEPQVPVSTIPTFTVHASTAPQSHFQERNVDDSAPAPCVLFSKNQDPIKEAIPAHAKSLDVLRIDPAPTTLSHDFHLKQEQDSPTMALQSIFSSSLVTCQPTATANTSDMIGNYYRERMESRSGPMSMILAPTISPQRLPTADSGVAAMMMNRAEIERQWLEAEHQRFRLIEDLQSKVREELEKFQVANREAKVMAATNTALRAKCDKLQVEAIALQTQLDQTLSQLREVDQGRVKLMKTQELLRSQTITRIVSIKERSVEAFTALEKLALDKSQCEVESARLHTIIQELQADRDHLKKRHQDLANSLSSCSDELKKLQAAYNESRELNQKQFNDIADYRVRCETVDATLGSLHAQLKQQSEMMDGLRREIDSRGVTIGSLEIANASLVDQIKFLAQSSDYQQSILQSQLQEVSEKHRETHHVALASLKAEYDADKDMTTKEIARLEYKVQESAAEAKELVARNQQLVTEVDTLRTERELQAEKVAQLQKDARVMAQENQRLLNSSMETQSDLTDEINSTVLEFSNRHEELRRHEREQAQEHEAEIQAKETQINVLQNQLQTMAADMQASKVETQQLDRKMLELRVKIQLLQLGYDAATKMRDELKIELDSLQEQTRQSSGNAEVGVLARVTGSSGSARGKSDPMQLTEIARLHSRDRDGASSAVTEFSWPEGLDTLQLLNSTTDTLPNSATAMATTSTTAAATATGTKVWTRSSGPASEASATVVATTTRSAPSSSTAARVAEARSETGGVGTSSAAAGTNEVEEPSPVKKRRRQTGKGTTSAPSSATKRPSRHK
ncbi:hypothetical protein EC991_010553 [Linnemannia zychae]|nr:hypothetical protein EC991_010553 [Linnemannia zychae]